MKRIIASSLLAAGLLGAGLAQSAGADLSVKGTLQAGACDVAVGNGGIFDAGSLKSDRIDPRYEVWFYTTDVPLTITCTTPTRFGLHLEDNCRNSVIPLTYSQRQYGLGMSGGKKIGNYVTDIYGHTSGGKRVDLLRRQDSTSDWESVTSSSSNWWPQPGYLLGFARAGDMEPAPFDHISATLRTDILIHPVANLDLSERIEFDGSATLELVYL